MGYLPSRKAAEKLGVHPNTLRRWANSGLIRYIRTSAGHRRYDVESYLDESKAVRTVCYCRVSSYKQKDDLRRQVEHMQKEFPEAEIVKDIGSGLNFKRKGLVKAILERAADGDKLRVISAHKDRLSRFGFELVRWIVERSGGEIVVLNENNLSPEQELVQDLLTVLHVFSCRMHGLGRYKDEIDKAFSDKGAKKDV